MKTMDQPFDALRLAEKLDEYRTIAARLHAAYLSPLSIDLADVDPSHPIRLAHDALIAAAEERDAIMHRHAIETDESLAECVERSIAGWERRARKAESHRDALREALELIAAPRRPDGTWNRDREACRQLAAEALDAWAAQEVRRRALDELAEIDRALGLDGEEK